MEAVQNKREGQEVNAEEQPLQKKGKVNGFEVTQSGKRLRTAYEQPNVPINPHYDKDLYDFDEKTLIGGEAFDMTPVSKNGGTKRKKRRRNNKKTKRNRRKTKRNRK